MDAGQYFRQVDCKYIYNLDTGSFGPRGEPQGDVLRVRGDRRGARAGSREVRPEVVLDRTDQDQQRASHAASPLIWGTLAQSDLEGTSETRTPRPLFCKARPGQQLGPGQSPFHASRPSDSRLVQGLQDDL